MKNLEPISRIYFLLFAGVTGLIILMLFCGCNKRCTDQSHAWPTNSDVILESDRFFSIGKWNGDAVPTGGVFIFDGNDFRETNEFDVNCPISRQKFTPFHPTRKFES